MGIVLGVGCAYAVNAFVPDDYVLTLGSAYTEQTLFDKLLVIVNPVFYALLKPLARFDAGPISDRVFDYLVLYRTLRGLKKGRA